MSIFDRVSRRQRNELKLTEPAQAWTGSLAAQSYAGETVTPERGLTMVPVFSAIQLISGAISSLPLKTYQTLPDGGKVYAPKHRAQRILDRPTPTMAGDEWRAIMATHLCTWGNFFAYKERDNNGQVINAWPLAPNRVQVARRTATSSLEYFIDGQGPFDERSILHIRGMSLDGVVGLSPIQQARHSLGTSAALERYRATWWKNGARPSGVITHPQRLTAEAAARLRAQWQAQNSGDQRATVSVLEEGMAYQAIPTVPAEDQQLLEQIGLNRLETALLFRIPPHMLGASNGDSLHYSTTELEGRHFVTWTLNPILMRIEQALFRDPDLYLDNGLGAQFFPKFDTGALMRGDLRTQAETDVALLAAGIITRDEARANLDLNPLGEPAVDASSAPADALQQTPDATGGQA